MVNVLFLLSKISKVKDVSVDEDTFIHIVHDFSDVDVSIID